MRQVQRATGTDPDPRIASTPRSEELHVRNFDVSRAYDLTVRIYGGQKLAFASRYHLTPGKTESETDRLRPGEYEVVAELDGRRQERARCRIGGTPDRTALVELGNGTVSITQGHYR